MDDKTTVLFKPFPRQREFQDALASGEYLYLMFGGAIKGGKTILLLSIVIVLCKIFPGSRWAIVRKDLPRIKKNVLPVWEKVRPKSFVGELNRQEMTATCANGSMVLFFAENIDRDPDLDRWKGLDLNGFVLEEANELHENSYNKAIERAGSWIIPPGKDGKPAAQPLPYILLSCNPADNWVKRIFYTPWKEKRLEAPYFFLPSSIFENPYLTDAYRESLKNLPEKTYQRFVIGDWSVSEEPDQLIKFEWVENAMNATPVSGKRKMAVDVARFGNDDTIKADFFGNHLNGIGTFTEGDLSITDTAKWTMQTMQNLKIDADRVGVDTVGLGAGVADILIDAGYNIVQIVAGAVPVEIEELASYSFFNLRSQMWWYARELLRTGRATIGVSESKLIEDLTAPKYKMSADKKIKVESKEEIKKRIGRSTDYGDAFVMGLFVEHVQKVPGLFVV